MFSGLRKLVKIVSNLFLFTILKSYTDSVSDNDITAKQQAIA